MIVRLGLNRLSSQLYLGIGGAVAFTLVATLVAWLAFDRVGDVQSRVDRESIPALAAAFAVARQSGTVVAAAPRLITAANPDELARTVDGIAESWNALQADLDALRQSEDDAARTIRIQDRGAALMANVEAIQDLVELRLLLGDRSRVLRDELGALRDALGDILVPAIDDQWFFALTGYRDLGAPAVPPDRHFTPEEFTHYRRLAWLRSDAVLGAELLLSGFNVTHASLLEPLRERFEDTARAIDRRIAGLGDSQVRGTLAPAFARLVELGLGSEGGFELRARELAVAQQQQELFAENRALATELAAEAEGLVNAARAGALEATRDSAQAILVGRSLLLGISVTSAGGAILIAWLFVARVVMRRLDWLSSRMRRLAGGDLETRVEIHGQDEVAEMAAALEVFRRHALEVQRLNLVEKLAEEVKGKNAKLETALVDLERAQDQIVMGQKLAALGELTAGVAHEIRNPLNFVKNFSEASEELLEELLEEVRAPAGADGDSDDRKEMVAEISQDLAKNLKRIREHGARADRIVESMLLMGRESGERQMTDLNALLDEHARLAYHSARATNPDFNLEIVHDFDPMVGEVEVIPSDLGRVFLNMVTNACHATDERRRESPAASGYEPTLRLATKRLPDRIEVRVRDNGNGMPPEIIERIFHPFFTTKPAGQGTGLGLALSNDIVRAHGGTIHVESEPGAFTEMTVELPLAETQKNPEELVH